MMRFELNKIFSLLFLFYSPVLTFLDSFDFLLSVLYGSGVLNAVAS